ncbi:MAG TPA: alpha/beta fold hydrolase [Gemmatimonadales bacterium]|nr:alpha/beta fold hydrolase [Gemmatimonadales bacterium]
MSQLPRPQHACVIAMVLAACSTASPARRPDIATAGHAVREGQLDAGGGISIGYRIAGTGPDTLIVIHGGPGFTLDYLAEDLEPLAARHTVIFYDQRGSGRSTLVSDSAQLTGERFADDLEALRRHFRLERLNLLGHSWGPGVIALYAQKHPERLGRLLIVSGLPLTRAGLVESFTRMAASRDSGELRGMDAAMTARQANPADPAPCRAYYAIWFRPFFADTSSALRTKGDICAGSAESRRNKMQSVDRFTFASLGDWDWRPLMRTVQAPTLVIHGTEDPLLLVHGREWAATLPNSRLLVLDDIGHFPYVEAPERFFPPVETFLSGEWPAGAVQVPAR